MKTGIYKLVDLKGRFYIGSSVNIPERKKLHFRELRKNKHDNIKLQNYYNKYGENSIQLEIIETCEYDSLIEREQFYIDLLKPHFNICLIAGKPPSWAGKKHKPETVAKIKSVRWKHSTASRTKMMQQRELLGTNDKISAALKNTYAITGGTFLGRKHKPEFGQKMSVLLKGRIFSPETIEKMKAAQKGKVISEETKLKMIVSRTGKKHTPEAIDNMKAAAKKRFENPEYRAKQLVHLKNLSEAKRKK